MSSTDSTSSTELILTEHDRALLALMAKRTLIPAEAEMMMRKDRNFQIRKVIEKIIYSIPGILLAVANLMKGGGA